MYLKNASLYIALKSTPALCLVTHRRTIHAECRAVNRSNACKLRARTILGATSLISTIGSRLCPYFNIQITIVLQDAVEHFTQKFMLLDHLIQGGTFKEFQGLTAGV